MSTTPAHPWRRYVAIGDSFSEGMVDVDPRDEGRFVGWADRLAAELSARTPAEDEFRYANLAIRGRKIDDVVGRQLGEALLMTPDLVSIVGGGNDILRPRVDLDAIAARLDDVRTGTRVTSVSRHADGVDVRTAAGVTPFDRAVIAVHADQALALLADATVAEKEDLTAIRYTRNATLLHRDTRHLPTARRARASWNYRSATCGGADRPRVTYWMNRLQGFDETGDQLLVSLNSADDFAEGSVVARMDYAHPVFTREAVAAAARLRTAGGDRLAFAGAHLGWGFHEDGCRSGVRAAERLGASW